MNKLEHLQEIASNPDVRMFPSRHMEKYGEVMKALPGLLKVCDVYIELSIAYNEVAAHNFGLMTDRNELEKWAKEKVEAMLK
jgi:hypothetical protein